MATMSMPTRREYLKQIYKRYRFSNRQDKTLILDEFCLNTGYQRKYATRILNGPLKESVPRTGRRETYTAEHVYYLKKIWDILDQPCGQRLAPMLAEMIRVLARCKELIVPQSLSAGLVRMGSATIDRRLEPFRKNIWRRIHGTTKPGSLLKKQVPIVLSLWHERIRRLHFYPKSHGFSHWLDRIRQGSWAKRRLRFKKHCKVFKIAYPLHLGALILTMARSSSTGSCFSTAENRKFSSPEAGQAKRMKIGR